MMVIKTKHVEVTAEIQIKCVVVILVSALQLVHFCSLLFLGAMIDAVAFTNGGFGKLYWTD
jgi:hypothetical protein